jgi:hypothetical protein
MEYLTVDLAECPESPLAIIASKVLVLDELAGENPDRIDKVDAMLEDIHYALCLVPLEVHRT